MPAFTVPWEKAFPVIEPQINADGTHVYPFDLSFPIDVRFFTLGGRYTIRMNRHHYFEVFCVSVGKATVQVQERLFHLRVGDVMVIGSDVYHRFLHSPKSQTGITLLFFEPELIRTDGTVEQTEYLMPFLAQKSDFPHVIPARTGLPAEIVGLIHRIHKELPATTLRERLTVKTYLKMIMVLLVKHYAAYLDRREDFNRKRVDLQTLQPVFDYLEKHCDSRILVDDAAHLRAMSQSHFMYFFKRATGQSFLSYVNHFRIAKAQTLLTTTDKVLASISQEVGFCNQSHFGMVFRKLVGITPLAYRRWLGKGTDIAHMPP